MDVFPETAIAWALGAVKVGDLFGNIFSVLGNPDTVSQTNTQPTTAKNHQPQSLMDKLPKPIVDNYPSSFGKPTLHQLVNKGSGKHDKHGK